jgi:hypothetical protein
MRIAISAVVGMTLTLSGAIARAQPAPPAVDAAPHADAPPPAPPPPGSEAPPEAPAALPSPFPQEGESGERGELVGWRDGFFIRDAHDYFRLYPRAMVQTDFYSFFGPGTTSTPKPEQDIGLKPRFFVRRARSGFSGEFLKRWSFTAIVDFGSQGTTNAGGTAESAAGKPGETPSAASARYAPVQAAFSGVQASNIWVNYSVCPCLNFMVGQFNVPFSMENRTYDDYTTWMERSIATRGFAVPNSKDLGGMIWGVLGPKVFFYEIGVFGGDGQNRPTVDARADFIGRLFVRPFAGGATSNLARSAQIGVSARHGDRDPKTVAYDYSPITTGQGFTLWNSTYNDSLGRLVHIIPSGSQNAIGGELRARTDRFSLQAEAYYSVNNTREAVDGYQLANTERLGRVAGTSWYGQLSAWPMGDAFIPPEPGLHHPRRLDLTSRVPERWQRGLELMAIVAGINASYDGASRPSSTGAKSTSDAKTPNGNINIYEFGFGAQYWHTKHVRLAVNYIAYFTPGSGGSKTPDNWAVVPDNLHNLKNGNPSDGHVLHELGARLTLAF